MLSSPSQIVVQWGLLQEYLVAHNRWAYSPDSMDHAMESRFSLSTFLISIHRTILVLDVYVLNEQGFFHLSGEGKQLPSISLVTVLTLEEDISLRLVQYKQR